MKMFITLNSDLVGKSYINVLDISAVYRHPTSEKTIVAMTDNMQYFTVSETPEQVMELIEGCRHEAN